MAPRVGSLTRIALGLGVALFTLHLLANTVNTAEINDSDWFGSSLDQYRDFESNTVGKLGQ